MVKNKTLIIAEAGVNHNGNIKTAYRLIDEAAIAKADAIKFQTFTADTLVTKNAGLAKYQKKNTNFKSQYEMLKELEFPKKFHLRCIDRCKKKGIIFLSSPFSIEDIIFLKRFNMKYYKIPSGEITNLPYIKYISKLKKKVILSTGMSTGTEIKTAIKILKQGGTNLKNITLLHCNSAYPTPFEDVNLKSIISLRNIYKVRAGISDHSTGIEVPISAVALGAVIVEKHFTLSKKMKGPDHSSSIEPHELKKMITAIRNIEKSLNYKKKLTRSEKKNIKIVRKSIVAKRNIKKGEIFTTENITCKRPGTGISPMKFYNVIGLRSKKSFKYDDIIDI